MKELNQNIGFERNHQWFRYRAAGIIINDGAVLMVGNDHNDYFYSLGGAVQFGETAEQACLREVFEEAGLRCEIERLAFIHENFFTGQEADFLNDVNCHELSFYFLLKPLTDLSRLESKSFGADGSKEFLKWIPLTEYAKYKAFPRFFADALPELDTNTSVKRIVTYE
ncbi:NUDIX hydrolase [Lactococcus kimchii]|uniref:NUDIX hydrolase n=1 Tax=Lactococcus sp. S-13 TaxID=2507158 RepID=UPI001023B3F1|nr:NUDIX hydrolase [Lactococcus sp. S-13]RZI49608.1 NUDIX domain-containing protein [Lactococcus sp. S-13]